MRQKNHVTPSADLISVCSRFMTLKLKRKSSSIHEKLYMTHAQYFGDNFSGSHYADVRATVEEKPVSRATRNCVAYMPALDSFWS